MRNIFCKHYSKCLDRSIAEDLLFDCKGCTHYEKSEKPDSDIFGCYFLNIAIFLPEAYRSYRKMEKTGDLATFAKFERLISELFVRYGFLEIVYPGG